MENTGHIVSAFDQELSALSTLVNEMGGVIESQLTKALALLHERTPNETDEILETDLKVDGFESEIEDQAIEILALRQPVAEDLRAVAGAFKLASDLERIGDYTCNIAKRAIAVTDHEDFETIVRDITDMGHIVQKMISDVLDAYSKREIDIAFSVIHADQNVDRIHTSVVEHLVSLIESKPAQAANATHLIFISKDIERIGDHATNIAERVIYILRGHAPTSERPKGDNSIEAIG